jgi:thioredoxin 1
MSIPYSPAQPERSEIDASPGLLVLDFGTDWCGHCRAAAPLIEQALASVPEARHIKVEDGSGRTLGRSFKVKLWPTVVVIKDGREVARVVRPDDAAALRKALQA